jgi:outer membrane receptor protein involved in Fe transport
VTHAGARADVQPVFPYGRVSNEAHTTADLMFQLRFGSITPYVRVENLTDEEYEEVLGFASPRRRALLGLRYTVK